MLYATKVDPQISGGKTFLSVHCDRSSIWGRTNLSPALPLLSTSQCHGTLFLYARMMMTVMIITSPLYIYDFATLKVLSNLLFSQNPKKQAGKTLLVLLWVMKQRLQGVSDQPKDTCLALEPHLLDFKPAALSTLWGAQFPFLREIREAQEEVGFGRGGLGVAGG